MAYVKNTMKLIDNSVGKINPYYEMSYNNVMDIHNYSKDWFEMICSAFRFGYVQGMKATKAEVKKKCVTEENV